MKGEELYEIAIDLMDMHNMRFCDMMDEDSKVPILARKYFAPDDEYVCGWGRFRKNMIDSGNSEWLRRIESLDEQKMIDIAGRGLLNVLTTKDSAIDRVELDNYVKAIQGLANRSKIVSDNKDNVEGDLPLIKIEFMPMRTEPKEISDE